MRSSSTSALIPTFAGAVGGACLMFALVQLKAFDAFYQFTRQHESWELDEIALALTVGALVGLSALAICLYRDLARARTAYAHLQRAHDALREQRSSFAGSLGTTAAPGAVVPGTVTRKETGALSPPARG